VAPPTTEESPEDECDQKRYGEEDEPGVHFTVV